MGQIDQKMVKKFAEDLIKQISEFQELQQARTALANDPTAKKIWEDKEQMRETMEVMKQNNLPISKEQEITYSSKLKDMRENPICLRYLKGFNLAGKVSGKIGAELSDLIGVDFDPKRGC